MVAAFLAPAPVVVVDDAVALRIAHGRRPVLIQPVLPEALRRRVRTVLGLKPG